MLTAQTYLWGFVSKRAVVIFFIMVAIIIWAFLYILHLVVWAIWYGARMRIWKKEFENCDEDKVGRFLRQKRRMKRLALPIAFWFKRQPKHDHEVYADSNRHHHRQQHNPANDQLADIYIPKEEYKKD